MNLAELQAERSKIVREIEETTKELQADLAAVDRLISREAGASKQPERKSPFVPTVRHRSRVQKPELKGALANVLGKVNMAALVRQAIAATGGQPFSKNTIVEWMAKHHPMVEPNHPTISAQLWHMDDKGLLETVKERNGNKPALYKSTEHFAVAA